MGQRVLLIGGAAAIAASLVIGLTGLATGGLGGRSGDIGMDRAVQIAKDTAASYPGGGLAADEVIEFSGNYYASVRETGSGVGAFEVLIDRSSGAVTREPGPDMMWNTKYSPMGGMMAGYSGAGLMTVSPQQARDLAQSWLDSNLRGFTAKTPDAFYGYYTVDFESGSRLAGMLSVNGYTGRIWYHSWHGSFVRMRDLGT